jgi:hypothetical protein
MSEYTREIARRPGHECPECGDWIGPEGWACSCPELCFACSKDPRDFTCLVCAECKGASTCCCEGAMDWEVAP